MVIHDALYDMRLGLTGGAVALPDSGQKADGRGRMRETMTEPTRPRVSIGLPVYNGEPYVARMLDSILAQSFADFEVFISDNCSTDATAEICRAYAERDPRFHYSRTDRNIGAAPNFNRVYRQARSPYFIWACSDDFYRPGYLEKCVALLDSDRETVLCHSDTANVGPDGTPLAFDPERGVDELPYGAGAVPRPVRHLASQASPLDRFVEILKARETIYALGLIRRSALEKTSLLASFHGSDEILLMELAMQGRFRMVDEALFCRTYAASSSFFLPKEKKDSFADVNNQARKRRPAMLFTRAYLVVILRAQTLTALEKARGISAVFRKTASGLFRDGDRWVWHGAGARETQPHRSR